MAKLSIANGSTGVGVNLFIQDKTSTTGAGLAGLAYNTSGLTCYRSYAGPSASSVQVTLVTLAAVSSAHSDGGFKEIDATNMTGWYRFDIPDALLSGGSGQTLSFHFQGGGNMAPLPLEIELTAINNQSTGFGLVDASANVVQWNGTNVAAPATAGIPEVNVKNINNVSASPVTTVKAVIGLTTADTIATYTGNTPQTGDAFARLGAPAGASIAADLAEIEGETDGIAAIPTTPVLTAHFDTIIGTPAGASIAADLAEIEAETDGIAAIPTNNGTNQTGDTYGLLTGANTELAAVPASTAKIIDMLKWLFLLARNKITQTSTTTLARNDGDSATVGTSTISDDGTTFTRGKFS